MKNTFGKKQRRGRLCQKKKFIWNIVLSRGKKWGKVERVFYGKNDFLSLNSINNKSFQRVIRLSVDLGFFLWLLALILYQEETIFNFIDQEINFHAYLMIR